MTPNQGTYPVLSQSLTCTSNYGQYRYYARDRLTRLVNLDGTGLVLFS